MKKMQEKYEIPQMEVVEFETEDIITTSGDADTLPVIPAVQLKKQEGIKPRILVFQKISRKEW